MSAETSAQVNFNLINPEHITSLSSEVSGGSVNARDLIRLFVESLTDRLTLVVNGKAVSAADTVEIPPSRVLDVSLSPRQAPPPSIIDPLVDQLMKQTQQPASDCRAALEKCQYDFAAAVEFLNNAQ